MSSNAAGLTLTAGLRLHQRFVLRNRLHAGPRNELWLAIDEINKADVVVKTGVDASVLQREWQTLRALNHAHIVRAFDFFAASDDSPALFAQYAINGSPLSALPDVELAELLPPIRLLARALHYLHERDVSHGDLTPANIVFDRGGAPFLVDFGCASRGEIAVGAGAGTPAYRSPERGDGGPATPSDDIFALGRILAEFAGDSASAAVQTLLAEMTGPAAGRPDADAVDRRLGGAGAPAASLASLRVRAAPQPAEELPAEVNVQARTTTPPPAAQAAPPPLPTAGGGVPVRVVVIAAVVLIGAFVGVLSFVNREPATAPPADIVPTASAPSAEPPTAGTDAPVSEQAPRPSNEFGENLGFSEGSVDSVLEGQDLDPKQRAERRLGELLARQEVLEGRGVSTWAPTDYARAIALYESGDEYYLADDFDNAASQYAASTAILDRLIERVTGVFDSTVTAADKALSEGLSREAERLYGVALEITPNDSRSLAGLERAQKLDDVLALMEAATDAEFDGDYAVAKSAFDKALSIDPDWPEAQAGSERMAAALLDFEFREQMTTGFLALDDGRLSAARNAFQAARKLKPSSGEPTDGLLQVDQAARLGRINSLARKAAQAERDERWTDAVTHYEAMLKQDPNVAAATDGLAKARSRIALEKDLMRYLDDPDILVDRNELKAASGVLTRISRIDERGPRLESGREELTRILKIAATPLKVELVSDELTNVAVYKVGRLGQFTKTTLTLRPGKYTAVGTRLGYRDVRLEFRVAPETLAEPIVVRCVEPI